MRLTGKAALVTGGGSGIGLATALAFLEEGARVAIADISAAHGRDAVALARARGRDLVFIRGDVGRVADARRIVETARRRMGRIDVLFANAGILIEKPIHALSEAAWDRILGVNLKGAFFTAKYAVRDMRRRRAGAIVFTGSVNSLVGDVGDPAYCASKGGIALLTKAMALDYARDGIRVNAVCPGWVETPMFAQEAASRGLALRRYREIARMQQPMGRVGTPEEIARVVVFLASDEASYITGSLVVADGGFSAQ